MTFDPTGWTQDETGWSPPKATNAPSPILFNLPPAATDATSTQTLANAIRTLLVQLGMAK